MGAAKKLTIRSLRTSASFAPLRLVFGTPLSPQSREGAKKREEKIRLFMVTFLLIALLPISLVAQAPPPAGDPQTPDKPTQAPAAPQQNASSEGFKWGLMEGRSEVEVGYRWVSDIAGNRDMYRSMVNLGEGIKLLRSSLSLRAVPGTGALFDRLDLSLNSWGGDPYNTMRFSVGRMDLYEFRADYRNLNYYNFIPTYANPLLARGGRLGQHSLNVTYRTTDLELKLFPTRKIRPYAGYSRSSGFGPGFTTYGPTGNEFLLGTRWQYNADDYRGGVEFRFSRWNLTLEQGYRFFSNDTSASQSGDPVGNNPRPFLGQPIVLDTLGRSYHDRTKLPFSKILTVLTPLKNLTITGRYVYAMADVESELGQIGTGNLASLEDSLLYKTAADSFDTRAKKPSHSGGFVIEYSPFSRLTLLNHFETRNYHISGSALLGSVFYSARPLSGPTGPTSDRRIERVSDSVLSYDQTRNQAEFEFDLGRGFAIHAGHRYSFVETTLQSGDEFGGESESGNVTQQTGIGGFSYSRGQWLRLMLDYENTHSDDALMRTDLFDYDQFRFDWRVRLKKNLSTTGRVAFLRNSNAQSDIDLKSHRRNYAVSLSYEPADRFALSLDYSRTNIYSNLAILLPQTLDADRSLFDERSDAVGGTLGLQIYRGNRVEFGYRAILNLGSYPLNYHQPFASLSIPLPNHLTWRTNWQYFGYNEKVASLQDYRGHLITFSLAYSY